ncbi:unnamed protein product [Closterium sp. Yama58-4]|nr:unnamed protein product [Closterium sp. Yama58-4]
MEDLWPPPIPPCPTPHFLSFNTPTSSFSPPIPPLPQATRKVQAYEFSSPLLPLCPHILQATRKVQAYEFSSPLLPLCPHILQATRKVQAYEFSSPLLPLCPHILQATRKVQAYEFSSPLLPLCPHILQATRKVQAYEFSSLKDAALEAPEEAVVEFADIALDCVKVPGSRRPPMKDVARRLQALLSRHCSEGEGSCGSLELSMPEKKAARETMAESLERLTSGGDRDTFGRSEISEDL